MLVLLCIAHNTETLNWYFCSAYLGIKEDDDESTEWMEQPDALECSSFIHTLGWVCYVPLILFQIHCILTLKAY